ncbi:MAG: hypothetical protein HY422_01535 [Candidatus Komeilibacteria bacterium]|nr:hypothetical protein [Candidatus Komeilibacteria bacterium]
MRFIFPYIFALLTWVAAYSSVVSPRSIPYVLGAYGGLCIGTAIAVARRRLLSDWNLWVNFCIFFFSSLGYTLIIASPAFRNAYIAAFGAVCGVVMYVALRFSRDANALITKNYVRFIGWIFILAFWQMLAGIYFMQVAYDASVWSGAVIIALLTFVLGRGIIGIHGLTKSSMRLVLLVLTLTQVEFSLFLTLLPIHYYVQATLATSWFYFIIELVLSGQSLTSRKAIFRAYSIALSIACILLLLTAAWQ